MITYNQFRRNKTAFEKAQTENPVVLKTGYGYIVLGAAAIYTVSITADFSINCTCTAGKHNKFCYHVASVLLCQLEAEAEAAEAAAQFDAEEAAHDESEWERRELGHFVEDDVACAIN
jgi:uncharacterized protein (DUF488 family)